MQAPRSYIALTRVNAVRNAGFDTSPPEMWLAHGGQIVFPFLGPSGEWTVPNLLKLFMDRLERMPWGLAGQYTLVLGRLLEADRNKAEVPKEDDI